MIEVELPPLNEPCRFGGMGARPNENPTVLLPSGVTAVGDSVPSFKAAVSVESFACVVKLDDELEDELRRLVTVDVTFVVLLKCVVIC